MLPRITPDNLIAKNYRDYLASLAAEGFSGEIRTDYAARLTVATDNSIYQVIPQAVIFPRTTEDIALALRLSQPFQHVRFSPRGGGTGTNGQSLSAGIIIDCSKFLNNILEMNLDEKWIRVQPGVVLDQLNQYLQPFGVHFAPDISPSNRATIGGMINTDACGNGSKIMGRTSDHVLDITCVLSNGYILQTSQENPLQQQLSEILLKNQTLILEKFFNAPRTLNGYNLKKAYQNKLDLNYLICGSEGTLAVVTECKLKLSPLPKLKKLVVIKYRRFEDALRASEITLEIKPLVIETIDEKLIALARQDSIYFQIKKFIDDADAINLVEFVGDDENSIAQQITQLCINIDNSSHATGYSLANNADEIKLLWELRKKSVGLISKKRDGTRRPIPFIEDTAVPPEKLADYIVEFKALLDRHQLIYGMYGHVDAGCVHVRPALDTRIPQDEKLVRELSDELVVLVKKYGGVIWGEHGKGFRSEFGPQFFGEELYLVLRQIKSLFDPNNQLNPGKIATPIDSTESVVKLDSALRGHFDKQISPASTHEYAAAIACNGNGACFNFSTQDVMCPSYKVTQDRIHSPKGRATVIREWLRQLALKNFSLDKLSSNRYFFSRMLNRFSKQADFSHEVFDAMAGCLSCKACANQCPLSVDVPDFKSKFLAHYHQRYPRKLRDFFIAKTEPIAQWQALFPRFFNWITQRALIRFVLKTTLKITDPPEVNIPASKNNLRLLNLTEELKPNTIILLQDAFTSFYEKNILTACYEFFSSLGFSVSVAPFFQNGKPLHVKGFLPEFNQLAKNNIAYLRNLAALNVPLIGIDPSITLTYRDEYQKTVPHEKLGFQVQLPQEFLQQHLAKLPKMTHQPTYFLLSHCTEKTALVESEKQWQTIFSELGITLIPLAAGCCGMAGSYGHELEHRNHSHDLFCMDWQQYIAETKDAGKYVLATGYSCRSQVKRFQGIKLQHPLEALTHIMNTIQKMAGRI